MISIEQISILSVLHICSWFFENCSRQQAETILTIGKEFGNTLMRMSSTHKDHGSYVISKMFEKENRYAVCNTSS